MAICSQGQRSGDDLDSVVKNKTVGRTQARTKSELCSRFSRLEHVSGDVCVFVRQTDEKRPFRVRGHVFRTYGFMVALPLFSPRAVLIGGKR